MIMSFKKDETNLSFLADFFFCFDDFPLMEDDRSGTMSSPSLSDTGGRDRLTILKIK